MGNCLGGGGGGDKKKNKNNKNSGKGAKPSPAKEPSSPSSSSQQPKSDNAQVENGQPVELDLALDDALLYDRSASQQKVTQQDFQLMKVIGKGSFGKVMQVRKRDDGKIYAMKVLNKDAIIARKQVAHTRSEKSILQLIQHPFIVGLHYAFQSQDKLYMILDFINGGELFYHLKREGRFTESRAKFYVGEITLALEKLHYLGVVYRDLKPENVLLDSDGHVVITDFGLSKQIDDTQGTRTFCGTPEYLAPEVLRGQGHGKPVDWWSLGTLMFEMLTGLPPFYSQNINIMYQKILGAELLFPGDMTLEARAVLTGLLCREVNHRFTAREMKQQAWFEGIDWDKLYRREMPPPWVPPVSNKVETSQIDPAFTVEMPKDTPVERSPLQEAPGEEVFEGFTWVNPSEIGTAVGNDT